MKLKKDTIVRFALDAILQFSKKRKRKMIVTYRGIELIITKKSTVFSIVKEYKEKDKVCSEELIALIQEQLKRLEKPLNFPI